MNKIYGLRIRNASFGHPKRWCIDTQDEHGEYHYTGYFGESLEAALAVAFLRRTEIIKE